MIRRPPISTLFPYPTLSGSEPELRLPFDGHGAPRFARQRTAVRKIFVYGFGDLLDDTAHWLVLGVIRSEEHTSELQSRLHLVCRLLLEKKKKQRNTATTKRA